MVKNKFHICDTSNYNRIFIFLNTLLYTSDDVISICKCLFLNGLSIFVDEVVLWDNGNIFGCFTCKMWIFFNLLFGKISKTRVLRGQHVYLAELMMYC